MNIYNSRKLAMIEMSINRLKYIMKYTYNDMKSLSSL